MNVGITGHQRLDDSDTWGWVESAIDDELNAMVPPLIAVSSLAIGADQLFVSLVARRSGQIYAVIPFPDYERTFGAQNVGAYRRILATAISVEILQTPGTDEDAYLAAGRRVVELSDLMIAVWNGHPAKGKGGTADIVAYAAESSVPLIHINPADRTTTRK